MFTIRNLGGVALFLFGTTFLWLTPSFATKGISTKGLWWSATNVLALATLAVFTAATWGLFSKAVWWEGVAIVAAVIGAAALVPYWIAAHSSGEKTADFNVLIHVVGDAGVFVLLLVPTLQRWVGGHVMSGR